MGRGGGKGGLSRAHRQRCACAVREHRLNLCFFGGRSLGTGLRVDHVAARGVHDALGAARAAGGVQQEQRVLRLGVFQEQRYEITPGSQYYVSPPLPSPYLPPASYVVVWDEWHECGASRRESS